MIVARIHGEAILELPQDLYIPPEALEIVLETFEGPLDLLLYLIRKHNLDILDIRMAELTRQYMTYIDTARQQHELAAEYLLMAALLIEVKSRMLLPRSCAMEEENDPRAELVRRLLEYEKIKQAAVALEAMEQVGRDFFLPKVSIDWSDMPELPVVCPDDLRNAWMGLLARARVMHPHKVSRDDLSVREHMARILRALQGGAFAEFTELFEKQAGIVVTFLALLELAREHLVFIVQSEPFGAIYVKANNES
ncbi:MAG: segregation/condensation protein A [Burkholderiales bacterium]|nr:segregation/condensation protein A [Burkholderiales bacterium]